MKGHRDATGQYHWIAFRDDAGGMPADRANTCVSLPRHRNAVDERGTGSGNYLAAVASRVAESNHALHALPPNIRPDRYPFRKGYRSAIQRQTV